MTGQFNSYRLLNALAFVQFPAESPPLLVFLQLYDGIGRYELTVELRNLADETRVAAEISSDLDFPERLVKMDLVVTVDAMRLPRAGRYEIAILLDDDELATQFIDVEVANGQSG